LAPRRPNDLARIRLLWRGKPTGLEHRSTGAFDESPGGFSPAGAPRTVREPLDSYGSRCSAVSMAERQERLCLLPGLLPSPVGPRPRLNNAAPSVRPHYRAFIPITRCSAPVLRFGTLDLVGAAWSSPLASERQVLTFRTRAWLSFAPPAGCRSGGLQTSPELIPEEGSPPVSTSPNPLSTLHRRFACARLSQPCLPGSRPDVSATLTIIALDDSSSRWLETCT
jgi:hypothetical protein